MKRSFSFAFVLIFLLLFSGCLYTKIKTPFDTDVSETQLGEKTGHSSYCCILWLVAWGNGGTEAAAKNGGITTINHLDSEYFSILFGLYSRRTIIAYGD